MLYEFAESSAIGLSSSPPARGQTPLFFRSSDTILCSRYSYAYTHMHTNIQGGFFARGIVFLGPDKRRLVSTPNEKRDESGENKRPERSCKQTCESQMSDVADDFRVSQSILGTTRIRRSRGSCKKLKI